jgi:hypothetical protein
MGWFGKDKKKELEEKSFSLPELPRLPEFPDIRETESERIKKPLHQLPSFPPSSIGEKFSRNTIKDAISGEEGDKNKYELEEDEEETFTPPMNKPLIKEIPRPEILSEPVRKSNLGEISGKIKNIEPVFIRIDKFEESLQIFEKTKKKISEIEEMLRDIQNIREKEDEELQVWENNMKKMKEDIEKVDQDIFSKIQ